MSLWGGWAPTRSSAASETACPDAARSAPSFTDEAMSAPIAIDCSDVLALPEEALGCGPASGGVPCCAAAAPAAVALLAAAAAWKERTAEAAAEGALASWGNLPASAPAAGAGARAGASAALGARSGARPQAGPPASGAPASGAPAAAASPACGQPYKHQGASIGMHFP